MPRVERGKYDLVAVVHWFIDYKDAQIDRARRGDETENQARTRLLKANADMRELELAELSRELIREEVAVRAIRDALIATKKKLLAIPSRVGPQVVGVQTTGEAVEILETYIHEALEEIAELGKTNGGGGPAIPDRNPPGNMGGNASPASANRERVGGRKKGVKQGGERRTRKVADVEGGVPAGNNGRRNRTGD